MCAKRHHLASGHDDLGAHLALVQLGAIYIVDPIQALLLLATISANLEQDRIFRQDPGQQHLTPSLVQLAACFRHEELNLVLKRLF